MQQFILDTETFVFQTILPIAAHVFVFIPGNPGIAAYYYEYLNKLHQITERRMEILCMTYPGHSAASVLDRPLGLEEQVEHKLLFLDYCVKKYPNASFIIGGHSLGAYISARILYERPNLNLCLFVGLFPTLHSMAISPQGRIVRYLSKSLFRTAIVSCINLVKLCLSRSTLRSVVQFVTGHSEPALEVTLSELIMPSHVGMHALSLAEDEMNMISSLDHRITTLLSSNAEKSILYYGTVDEWVPLYHYKEMMAAIPKVKSHLCKSSIPHAFVIKHSDLMAQITSQWLRDVL